jgi:hypothetical protein
MKLREAPKMLSENSMSPKARRRRCRDDSRASPQRGRLSQTEHEDGDDHRHGFGVDSIDGEQCALPDNLIEKCGNAREKEEQAVDSVGVAFYGRSYRLGDLG